MRVEPVHVDEVAARLTELTLGEPAGRVPDIVGPDVLGVAELVATYVEFHGKRRPGQRRPGRRRPRVPVRLPGEIGRAYRAGDNLANATALRGQRGWAEFLAEQAVLESSKKDIENSQQK